MNIINYVKSFFVAPPPPPPRPKKKRVVPPPVIPDSEELLYFKDRVRFLDSDEYDIDTRPQEIMAFYRELKTLPQTYYDRRYNTFYAGVDNTIFYVNAYERIAGYVDTGMSWNEFCQTRGMDGFTRLQFEPKYHYKTVTYVHKPTGHRETRPVLEETLPYVRHTPHHYESTETLPWEPLFKKYYTD